MSKHYHYDFNDACKYGADIASIISNFKYWIDFNRCNETNFKDGRTWTYNTLEAFQKQFPWLSAHTIQRHLSFLVKEKILVRGNFGKFNRTNWYAFYDEELMFGISHDAKMAPCIGNSVPEAKTPSSPLEMHHANLEPCMEPKCDDVLYTDYKQTDYKQKIKTNVKKTHASRGACEKLFESLWEVYPLKKSRQKALEAFIKTNPTQDMVETMKSALRLQMRERAMLREKNMFVPNHKHLATWLNQRCWLDEVYDPEEEEKAAQKASIEKMRREIIEEQQLQQTQGRVNGYRYG